MFSVSLQCYAGVMELADVPDSKSGPGDRVRVRPPPPAPTRERLCKKVSPLFFVDMLPKVCQTFGSISLAGDILFSGIALILILLFKRF